MLFIIVQGSEVVQKLADVQAEGQIITRVSKETDRGTVKQSGRIGMGRRRKSSFKNKDGGGANAVGTNPPEAKGNFWTWMFGKEVVGAVRRVSKVFALS